MTVDVETEVRYERAAKRVRAMLGGLVVADTLRPLLVWERPYYPTYYFPIDDVDASLLRETGKTPGEGALGDRLEYTLTVGDRRAAAHRHPAAGTEVGEAIAFRWDDVDHWFEEDEEVFTHARDPHTRIDALRSSRHVRVEVGGVTVANSHSPTLLFETGLPTRHYLPKTDVRMDLLEPSETVTHCPYKGTARYWSVGPHKDVAWGYDFPTAESIKIAGMIAFYDERVDTVVDGREVERPASPWSR